MISRMIDEDAKEMLEAHDGDYAHNHFHYETEMPGPGKAGEFVTTCVLTKPSRRKNYGWRCFDVYYVSSGSGEITKLGTVRCDLIYMRGKFSLDVRNGMTAMFHANPYSYNWLVVQPFSDEVRVYTYEEWVATEGGNDFMHDCIRED